MIARYGTNLGGLSDPGRVTNTTYHREPTLCMFTLLGRSPRREQRLHNLFMLSRGQTTKQFISLKMAEPIVTCKSSVRPF